jgi:putative ABC transport system permease protein
MMGLSLVFCVTIPLACNVKYHKSFDKFHPDYERIYNVYINEVYRGTRDIYGELPLVVGEYLQRLFPEIEGMVRIKDRADNIVSTGEGDNWKEDVLWADPSFGNVFQIDLLSGNKSKLLSTNEGAYISQSLAQKMFKTDDPIGKEIRVNDVKYLVAGIFKNYPSNSHQKFSVLLPLERYISHDEKYKWDNYEFLTYIKVTPRTDGKELEKKLQIFISKYWIPWVKENQNLDYVFNSKNSLSLRLLPVSDIHLQGSFISSFEKEIKSSEVNINLIIILVLLVVAYFNLVGFAVSKGKKQQSRLMIKRCLGANNRKLSTAFVLENVIYTTIAFALALLFTVLTWNFYPELIGIRNNILPVVLLYLLSLTIAVLSGCILGIFFNQKQTTIKLREKSYSGFWLNRAMLIFQMAASVILLICISFLYKQLNYIANYPLGINPKNIVVISHASKIRDNYAAFKNELKKSPLIKEVACSNSYPFLWANTESYIHANSHDLTPYPFLYYRVDPGFEKVFDIKTAEGKWFSDESAMDKNGLILNEAAVKILEMKNPVGEELYKTESPSERYKVIGTVNNFNFQSLHHTIAPLLLCSLKEGDWWNYIEIKSTSANRKIVAAEIKRTWDKFAGNTYFDCSFLEDKVALMYEKEQKVKRTVAIFSLVAILISCFGLLGIVLNTTTEKTKEIGIRKVNGARVTEILTMLNQDFIKWVVIAFIIACPIAWYAMHKWLQNFAYKTELSWWVFALAGIVAVAVALLTVSWQSYKAAIKNPVESLRYE